MGRKFRFEHDSNVLYLRQALNLSPAFDGVEGTDWETVESYVLPSLPGAEHRVGVRDGYWVIDQTYLPDTLGFTGDINVDWNMIERHKLA
jgi:hypothetical protein